MTDLPSLESLYVNTLTDGILSAASRLKDMAASLESAVAQVKDPQIPTSSYVNVAARVTNDLMWMTANMNLGSLANNAAQADAARMAATKPSAEK